ncbi:AraC family transcriptional regulator [Cetobacterium somerae]|uniref:helix-turn-helix domain-containing protein n=1 Tax=Cetobacterium somerae TaxID=188913 RepID=UPI0022529B10|nr:AraC family transcriptional regulator [Cetobacterium somerae]MCX3067029.1 AraC family transcriptional regulator [Cetobacterium somerae]
MNNLSHLCNMLGVLTNTNVIIFNNLGEKIIKYSSFQVIDNFNLNEKNILDIKSFLIDDKNISINLEKTLNYSINFIGVKSLQKNIFFIVGPFLWTDPFYEKQKDLYNLKKNNLDEYTFYSNLKKVKTIPIEILIPLVFNLINCEFINIDSKPHTLKETIKESVFKMKNLNISSEDVELTNERYHLENLKLKYIKLGDYEKALKCNREMSSLSELNQRIPNNIFRSLKNGLFISSGIIRKAVEEAGVPPTFIHNLSSKIFTWIENSSTIAEVKKIDENIIKEYSHLCLFHNEKYNTYSLNIKNALLFIDINKDKPISLSEVADFISLNPDYLSRLFKKEVGINFKDYIQKIKVDLAINYLENTNLKISEIAFKLDYCNIENFSKIFKKYQNVTPAKFKKNLEISNINKK